MWRRKGSALLNIGGDAACKVDPFDKPKLNWINCVRGGQRYRLQAQGDFCATAYEVLQWTKSLGSCICGEGEDRMADALMLALNVM